MKELQTTTRDVARELARKYSTMSHDELDILESVLVPKKYAKGEMILSEGDISQSIYYIEKGLVREFYYKNNKEVTEYLAVEGTIMMSIESLFKEKPSNLQIPMVGDIAYTAGYLAINRENDREALKTILQAADYLKRGVCSIGIFPEGTRTRTGKLQDFHAGSFKIAQRANVPLVIACVRDTEKVSHRLFLRPTKVYLDILEVLPAQQVKAMSTRDLAEYSRNKILEVIKE